MMDTRLNNSEWVGYWGKNCKKTYVFLKCVDNTFTGYYVVDSTKISFSGIINHTRDKLYLIFDFPMSDKSGGIYDIQQHKLFLYCDGVSEVFLQYEQDSLRSIDKGFSQERGSAI